MNPLPFTLKEFEKWLRGNGHLRTFWLKPVESITARETEKGAIIKISWKVRSKLRTAVLAASTTTQAALKLLREAGEEGGTVKLILTPEEAEEPENAWQKSILYYWQLGKLRLFDPNPAIKVEAHEEWNEELEREIKKIQESSWGFYKPPKPEVDVVLLAKLQDEAVGLAYLNKHTWNIDYGVHVAREHWRRRIGTTLVHAVSQYVASQGGDYFTVVRWLRSPKATTADKRALAFYKANSPTARLAVYRLR